MCGVFGFISNKGKAPSLDSLLRVAAVTERRGPHAFGFAWIDRRGRIMSYRQTGRITDHLSLLEMARDAVMLIGHCRYATDGDPDENINNHPHPSDGGWIVHNGVVSNFRALIDEHQLHPVSDCDSEVLGLLIERFEGNRSTRCMQSVNCAAAGALALLGLWPRPNTLVAIRRGNPLHASETIRGIYLASLADGMPGTPKLIEDGHALTFTLKKNGGINGRIQPLETARAKQDPHAASQR